MAQIVVSGISPTGVGIAQPNLQRASIPYTLTAPLAVSAFDILFNFTLSQTGQNFGAVRTIFVDNSRNPSAIDVLVNGPQQSFPVPPYTAGYYTVSSSSEAQQINFVSDGGASGKVYFEFFNYDLEPYTYSGFAPFIPGIEVVAKPAVGATINRNTTLAAGVAANVFPAVVSPTQKRFKNIGDDVAWYNTKVAATGTFANGDWLLNVGESVLLPYTYQDAISFWSDAGTQIQAEEF